MDAVNPYRPPLSIIDLLEAPDYGRIELFSFSGRIGRLRYFLYTLAAMALFLAVGAATVIPLGLHHPLTAAALLVVGIPAFIFSVCIAVQRLHDLNANGWWYLLFVLLGVLGPIELIFFAVLCLTPGNPASNRFGPPPPPNVTMTKGVIFVLLMATSIAVLFYINRLIDVLH